jgi:hypothetical protein
VLTAKLDAFAFELLTFLSMGKALQASAQARSAKRRPMIMFSLLVCRISDLVVLPPCRRRSVGRA